MDRFAFVSIPKRHGAISQPSIPPCQTYIHSAEKRTVNLSKQQITDGLPLPYADDESAIKSSWCASKSSPCTINVIRAISHFISIYCFKTIHFGDEWQAGHNIRAQAERTLRCTYDCLTSKWRALERQALNAHRNITLGRIWKSNEISVIAIHGLWAMPNRGGTDGWRRKRTMGNSKCVFV